MTKKQRPKGIQISEKETLETKNRRVIKAAYTEEQSITRKELFEMIREQIRHEDGLVNQRLNWLLASQAFLFAAFTALINSDKPLSYIDPTLQLWVIPFGITIMGFLITCFSFVGLRAAYRSLKNLRQFWDSTYSTDSIDHKRDPFPPVTWVGRPWEKAITTASATPFVILIAWSLLAMAIAPDWGVKLIVLFIGLIAATMMVVSTLTN